MLFSANLAFACVAVVLGMNDVPDSNNNDDKSVESNQPLLNNNTASNDKVCHLLQLPDDLLNLVEIEHPGICFNLHRIPSVENVLDKDKILFEIVTTTDDGFRDYRRLFPLVSGVCGHDLNLEECKLALELVAKADIPAKMRRRLKFAKFVKGLRADEVSLLPPTRMQLRVIWGLVFHQGSFKIWGLNRRKQLAFIKATFAEEFKEAEALKFVLEQSIKNADMLKGAERAKAIQKVFPTLFSQLTDKVGNYFRQWCLEFFGNMNVDREDPLSIINLLLDQNSLKAILNMDDSERILAAVAEHYRPWQKVLGGALIAPVQMILEKLQVSETDLGSAITGPLVSKPPNFFLFAPSLISPDTYQHLPKGVYEGLSSEVKYEFHLKCEGQLHWEPSFEKRGQFLVRAMRELAHGHASPERQAELHQFIQAGHRSMLPKDKKKTDGMFTWMLESFIELIAVCGEHPEDAFKVPDEMFESLLGQLANVPRQFALMCKELTEEQLASLLAKFVIDKPNHWQAVNTFFDDLARCDVHCNRDAVYKLMLGSVEYNMAQTWPLFNDSLCSAFTEQMTEGEQGKLEKFIEQMTRTAGEDHKDRMVKVKVNGHRLFVESYTVLVPRGARVLDIYAIISGIGKSGLQAFLLLDPTDGQLAPLDMVIDAETSFKMVSRLSVIKDDVPLTHGPLFASEVEQMLRMKTKE